MFLEDAGIVAHSAAFYIFVHSPRPLHVIEVIEKNTDIVNHHSATVIRLDFHGNAIPITLRTN
jgi:hypothetical protein